MYIIQGKMPSDIAVYGYRFSNALGKEGRILDIGFLGLIATTPLVLTKGDPAASGCFLLTVNR
jgi:hypothetical protein